MSGLRVVPVERPRKWGETLRIVDARSGRPVEIEPGYRSPLRVCAHLSRTGNAGSLAALRVMLVADVLMRIAELYGGQALVGVADAGRPADHWPVLTARAAEFGIHPPVAQGSSEHVEQTMGGTADVHVAVDMGELADAAARVRVAVGPVQPLTVPTGADPPAVRLALLACPHHEPVDLTPELLAEQHATLKRWRRAMAEWSQSPSRPMCADVLKQALAGLRNDLGTPAVLHALSRLEKAADLPDGSKFETFAHLDRVLGLELTRWIGRAYPD